MNEEKRVCDGCVGDAFLAQGIGASKYIEICDYCAKEGPTISLDELADKCAAAFETFYEGTADAYAVVYHDRDPAGDDIHSCLEELAGVEGELNKHLADVLLGRLSAGDLDEADPFYIKSSQLGAVIGDQWERVSQSLKHEARLINPDVVDMFDVVFGQVSEDVTAEGFDVFVSAGPGKSVSQLFRARVFQSDGKLEAALKHPERELGPLPIGEGRAGRMNSSGVSVFYGATDATVALAEVRPPVGSRVLVGSFKIMRELRLVNLDELGRLAPSPSRSLFDPLAKAEHARCDFLRSLTQRLTMPVMPDNEAQDYLITQAIADYLATHRSVSIDGIYFKSAQDLNGREHETGRNVVLFHKASRVVRAESQYKFGRSSRLMDNDDDHFFMQPEIMWNGKEPHDRRDGWEDSDNREKTLSLDLSSMEIRSVTEVQYSFSTDEVGYHKYDDSTFLKLKSRG